MSGGLLAIGPPATHRKIQISIPEIRRTPLRHTRRGYIRQLGQFHEESDVRAKFYLGHDFAEAAKKRAAIETLWVECCRMSGEGWWQHPFIDAARQIERTGYALINIDPEDTEEIVWLREVVRMLQRQGITIQNSSDERRVDVQPAKPLIIRQTRLSEALSKYTQDRLDTYAENQIGEFYNFSTGSMHPTRSTRYPACRLSIRYSRGSQS